MWFHVRSSLMQIASGYTTGYATTLIRPDPDAEFDLMQIKAKFPSFCQPSSLS
jgi:hypothetical protein